MAKKSSQQGMILHAGMVRMTISGEGDLKTSLLSNASVESVLTDYELEDNPDRMASLLSNFEKQKIQVKVGTVEFGEHFQLNNIIVFVTPVSTGYPQ